MIETGSVTLVISSLIAYENSRNPHELRREWVAKIGQLADHNQLVHKRIRQRAEELEGSGLKAVDALHVACAEHANVDYFVTCDDRLIRRYQSLPQQRVKTCNPTEFVRIVAGE